MEIFSVIHPSSENGCVKIKYFLWVLNKILLPFKNIFFNSTDANDPNANPWWNEYVMIFPSNANFPLGDIDLNGNGY